MYLNMHNVTAITVEDPETLPSGSHCRTLVIETASGERLRLTIFSQDAEVVGTLLPF